jgi:hypothetical protein
VWGDPLLPLSVGYYTRLLSVVGMGPRITPMCVVTVIGLAHLMVRFPARTSVLCLASIGGPLVLVAVTQPVGYHDRYLAVVVPYVLLVAAAGVAGVLYPLRFIRGLMPLAAVPAVLLAVALSVVSRGEVAKPRWGGAADWRGIAGRLEGMVQRGDVVVAVGVHGGSWKDALLLYFRPPPGVIVLSSSGLPRKAAGLPSPRTSFWVVRAGPDELSELEERLRGRFEICDTYRGLLELSARDVATGSQCCIETAGILEILVSLEQMPRQEAQGWAAVGALYVAGGDRAKARLCYERARSLDPHLESAAQGLSGLAQ